MGITPLVVGLTVVAFGTSAPELAVSLQSVRAGTTELAIGNIVGSNIFNILFILGVSALIVPLQVSRRVVRLEVPLMVAFSLLSLMLAMDGVIGVGNGLVLVSLLIAYTVWLVRTGSHESAPRTSIRRTRLERARFVLALLMTLLGLVLLVAGGRLLVSGAVRLAAAFGVDDVVIGLTIVALGTSLPEVAASIVATLRGHRDMAIGNVLGSNIFNLSLVMGASAVVSGGLEVGAGVVTFDFVVMVAVAIACAPIFFSGYVVARWEGALFLAYYGAYTVYLVLDATGHALLPHFRDALLLFALPLTAVTLAVLVARAVWPKSAGSAGGLFE
jgi:cation:H+ antiporter